MPRGQQRETIRTNLILGVDKVVVNVGATKNKLTGKVTATTDVYLRIEAVEDGKPVIQYLKYDARHDAWSAEGIDDAAIAKIEAAEVPVAKPRKPRKAKGA